MLRGWLHAAVLTTVACGGGSARTGATRADTSQSDSAGAAASECVRGEPEPALIGTGPAAGRPRFQRTGKLDAIEDARLNDTTTVRITHTGCAHYVQRFDFSVRGAIRDTGDARYWLEQAARYLEALPAVEDMRPQLADMTTALRSSAGASMPYSYGDPIRASELAHVYLSLRRAGSRAIVVEIVYDYAL